MKSKSDQIEKAKQELISLYLGIKLRKESDVNKTMIIIKIQVLSLTEKECINELNELKDISLLDIVQYIKNSIDVIVTLKIEEKKNEYKSKRMKMLPLIMKLCCKKKKQPSDSI